MYSAVPIAHLSNYPPAMIDRFEDIDWATWKPVETATLVFVQRDDEILLIRKKRGLGAG